MNADHAAILVGLVAPVIVVQLALVEHLGMLELYGSVIPLFVSVACIVAVFACFVARAYAPLRWGNVKFAMIAGLSTFSATAGLMYLGVIWRPDGVGVLSFLLDAFFYSLIWGFVPTLVGAVIAMKYGNRLNERNRATLPAAKDLFTSLFEVSVNVSSVNKTVTLEVASDHTVGSLFETVVLTLNLPKDRAYAVECSGRLIGQSEFGKSLAALGIGEGSRLGLRVVE